MYNEKRYVGRFIYLTVLCGHIPTLFPYFLVFHYPYILLHFYCFLILFTSFFLEAAAALSQSNHVHLKLGYALQFNHLGEIRNGKCSWYIIRAGLPWKLWSQDIIKFEGWVVFTVRWYCKDLGTSPQIICE